MLNLTEKIIANHLTAGEMIAGTEIGLQIDQTLTQDSTGTMVYLELEAMNLDHIKTKLSVAYVDHNMLQAGPENFDDHLFIQSAAKRYGLWFSKPGNGICHQVHLERFGVPGDTLIGSDSHTPTAGGLGMLAIGAGGMDVAAAMAGKSYVILMPQVVNVRLTGALNNGVSAKDVILHLLKLETVKGGVNKVYEYTGDGVSTLSVPERATITNMGAELGATSSIFPSDETTLAFLTAMGRKDAYHPLSADAGASYAYTIDIDLSSLTPLIACPHSPDNVVPVQQLAGETIHQVAIGSCTNSSYLDLAKCAMMLKGQKVHDDVSLVISPGSRQTLKRLADDGLLSIFLEAGARILECGCGPCIGMGQAPCNNGKSLRTFNRNFYGRSGTKSADVYLVSPEIAIVSALTGVITDPTHYRGFQDAQVPEQFIIDDHLLIAPNDQFIGKTLLIKGPNIKAFPLAKPVPDTLSGKILTKLEDNITTDHIMPSNASLLPYRSNIPYLANYCLTPSDEQFPAKALANNGGIIVAGENYGQGSSREHAALAPLYLGVTAVLAKSFARIHKQNLVNNGIIPLTFTNSADYDQIAEGDTLSFEQLITSIPTGKVTAYNHRTQQTIELSIDLGQRQEHILLAGGLLNTITI